MASRLQLLVIKRDSLSRKARKGKARRRKGVKMERPKKVSKKEKELEMAVSQGHVSNAINEDTLLPIVPTRVHSSQKVILIPKGQTRVMERARKDLRKERREVHPTKESQREENQRDKEQLNSSSNQSRR